MQFCFLDAFYYIISNYGGNLSKVTLILMISFDIYLSLYHND